MKIRRWEKMFLRILPLLLLTVATAGYAQPPCNEPLIKPEEFMEWEDVVDFSTNEHNGKSVIIVRNTSKEGVTRAVIYVEGYHFEMDPYGYITIIEYGLTQFCFLENGKLRDFFRCAIHDCFHESDISHWSNKKKEIVKRLLLDAQNSRHI